MDELNPDQKRISMKPKWPFWCVKDNFVINMTHVVWFQKHSDDSLTIGIATDGPYGSNQINVTDAVAIVDFERQVAAES